MIKSNDPAIKFYLCFHICLFLSTARGADVNALNSAGATPLHDAVARGLIPVVATLLDHGANLRLIAHKG